MSPKFLAIFLILVLCSCAFMVEAQRRCGRNEVWNRCGWRCREPRCRGRTPPCGRCTPGCFCRGGFWRNSRGRCVQRRNCS